MKADKDKSVKTLQAYEKRYKSMERTVVAANNKVKEVEHSLVAVVSVWHYLGAIELYLKRVLAS
jgi:hypothetical protein